MHTRTVPMGYSQKNIPYAPVKELDFTSAKGKKNKIDVALAEASLPIAKRVLQMVLVPLMIQKLKHFIKCSVQERK